MDCKHNTYYSHSDNSYNYYYCLYCPEVIRLEQLSKGDQ